MHWLTYVVSVSHSYEIYELYLIDCFPKMVTGDTAHLPVVLCEKKLCYYLLISADTSVGTV